MNFTSRKRRKAPSVIIVSLIDVLLVVLIFLMVTTAFKENIPAFRLTVPETSQAPPSPGATEAPPFIITITTNAPHFYIGRTATTFEALREALVKKAKENPQLVVALRADTEATYGNVVKVREAVQAAQVRELREFLRPGMRPQ